MLLITKFVQQCQFLYQKLKCLWNTNAKKFEILCKKKFNLNRTPYLNKLEK